MGAGFSLALTWKLRQAAIFSEVPIFMRLFSTFKRGVSFDI